MNYRPFSLYSIIGKVFGSIIKVNNDMFILEKLKIDFNIKKFNKKIKFIFFILFGNIYYCIIYIFFFFFLITVRCCFISIVKMVKEQGKGGAVQCSGAAKKFTSAPPSCSA